MNDRLARSIVYRFRWSWVPATLLSGMLLFAAGCGVRTTQQSVASHASPAAASQSQAPALVQPTAIAEPLTSPTSVSRQEDAWKEVRAALPANVVVYRPTFVPVRFGSPTALEARADDSDSPVYTIVYTAKEENLAFILNMGKGAWGNFSPSELNEPIRVRGMNGGLSISAESHAMGVFWQEQQGRSYQIKAFSQQMTKDAMERIVESLVPVVPTSAASEP